jgi:uncharacterized membrane protein YidH (DUF202 family)
MIRATARWAPFGGVIVVIAFVIIPNYPTILNQEQKPTLDLVGITAASLGVIALGFGISNFLVSELIEKRNVMKSIGNILRNFSIILVIMSFL